MLIIKVTTILFFFITYLIKKIKKTFLKINHSKKYIKSNLINKNCLLTSPASLDNLVIFLWEKKNVLIWKKPRKIETLNNLLAGRRLYRGDAALGGSALKDAALGYSALGDAALNEQLWGTQLWGVSSGEHKGRSSRPRSIDGHGPRYHTWKNSPSNLCMRQWHHINMHLCC